MHSDSYNYSYAADDGCLYSNTDVLVNHFTASRAGAIGGCPAWCAK